MKFGGIALDMDGVLIDSEQCHAGAFAELWSAMGIDGPAYAEIAGRPTKDVVVEVTASLHPTGEEVDAWVATKQRRARECLATAEILFFDAARTINSLGERYPLALVTGGSRQTVESTLARYRLDREFRVIVTGDDVVKGKPAPEAYTLAASAIVGTPERMLVVEDSENGILSGLGAGAFVVSVRSGHTRVHERFLGAFESLDDVLASLELLE